MTIYTFLINDYNSHDARVHKIFANNMLVAIQHWAHLAYAEDIIQQSDVQELFPKLNDPDFISNVIDNHEFELSTKNRNLPLQIQCFYKELSLPNFDIEESTNFIYNNLPEEIKYRIKTKDIERMVDLIYDFYDENGWAKGDRDEYIVDIPEDESIDYELLSKFIQKKSAKKRTKYLISDIDKVLDLEYEFLIKIGLVNEDDEDDDDGEMVLK